MGNVKVFDHPLILDKLARIRNENTKHVEFTKVVNELTTLMTYEITRDLPIETQIVKTPLEETECKVLASSVTVVPILRAGLGMVDGILQLIPNAKVGHIGLFRNEETLEAVEYFKKFPIDIKDSEVLVVDPMLATGGSAIAAINIVKQTGAKNIKFIGLVGVPEGVEALQKAHGDVDIFLAALDRGLNEKSYIVPGLGDCGDRIFGTK